jgi:6-phosphogluconolactonase/glucosamine-6-phosphate isomerase/deaminase
VTEAPEVIVRATPDDVSAAAAERIVALLGAAIDERGRADFVTTGGSTPIGIYKQLSDPLRAAIDWRQVRFWWGDDRFVPRDHPLSNVQAADSILFGAASYAGQTGNLLDGIDVQVGSEPGLVVPVEHIHVFPCETAIAHGKGAGWCAEQYAATLRDAGPRTERGFPVFDVVLLGLGPDGHLMSVFPGSAAFDSQDWAMAIPAPTHVEPHVERVTLNPAVLGVARSVLMVTSGAAKAEVVGRIFTGERDVRALPAQLVRRPGATWILDDAAAAQLPATARSTGGAG